MHVLTWVFTLKLYQYHLDTSTQSPLALRLTTDCNYFFPPHTVFYINLSQLLLTQVFIYVPSRKRKPQQQCTNMMAVYR